MEKNTTRQRKVQRIKMCDGALKLTGRQTEPLTVVDNFRHVQIPTCHALHLTSPLNKYK